MSSGYREFMDLLETISGVSGVVALDDILTFGKYEGEQLEDLIIDHPDYIEWLINNDVIQFDEEALELISSLGIA